MAEECERNIVTLPVFHSSSTSVAITAVESRYNDPQYNDIPGITINTPISENVVGENDECQLSNGDCTNEKKREY